MASKIENSPCTNKKYKNCIGTLPKKIQRVINTKCLQFNKISGLNLDKIFYLNLLLEILFFLFSV